MGGEMIGAQHMIKLNKRILGAAMAASFLALAACSGESGAQTKDDSHADHKHDEAPKTSMAITKALGVPSGNYTMDKTHGYVTFSYLHKGLSNPQLRFDDVDATLVLDADNPENSQINVTIAAANIDSGVAKFDAHLNSPDFFNSAANPTISFKSTGFTRADVSTGTMTGDLTMMGVTKSISFDVVLIGTGDSAIGVEGRTKLLRSDYGLGKYVPHVGDEVSITVSAEFNKDK